MKSIVLAVMLAIVAPIASARYEGVCREYKATGFDDQKDNAIARFKSLNISSTVSTYSRTAVYVEAYGPVLDSSNGRTIPGGLYFHSNFVTPGYQYPTKVAYPTNDMSAALENIISPTPLTGSNKALFLKALKSEVAFIFHRNVFDSDHTPIDLGEMESFFITDDSGHSVLVRREKKKEVPHCQIENPCWDKEKWEPAEVCDSEKTDPIVSIINAILQGAFSGFQCKMQRR